MYYDVFYLDDPRISNPDFEWDGIHVLTAGWAGPYELDRIVWHCLVHDDKLHLLPFGSLTFSNLPEQFKNEDGTPKHHFAGRDNVKETNGGFYVPPIS